MQQSPVYSVVITAHNEAACIRECLASVESQRGVACGELEIILVDDRSTDGTLAAAEASNVRGLRTLRIARTDRRDLTARQNALDQGFRMARGGVILTLDADGVVQDDWIKQMTGPILTGQADAIAGPVHFRAPHGPLAGLQTADVCFYLSVCRVITKLGFAGGALFGNFAFRTRLYVEAGGFEQIGFSLTEDLAFYRALHRANRRTVYVADGGVSVRASQTWSLFADRAKRVSAGGSSALAAVLTLWFGLFVFLAAAAALSGSIALVGCFLLRYAAGVMFVAAALLHYRQTRLIPWALLYELAMTIIGFVVIWRMIGDQTVEWGGMRYGRWSGT